MSQVKALKVSTYDPPFQLPSNIPIFHRRDFQHFVLLTKTLATTTVSLSLVLDANDNLDKRIQISQCLETTKNCGILACQAIES